MSTPTSRIPESPHAPSSWSCRVQARYSVLPEEAIWGSLSSRFGGGSVTSAVQVVPSDEVAYPIELSKHDAARWIPPDSSIVAPTWSQRSSPTGFGFDQVAGRAVA